MASSICSLQGLRPRGQCHPRLCSLQSIVQVDEINEIPALDNEINLPDIFDNLDDGEDQDIDINYYLAEEADDMDDAFLPTDSLTVRNHLLEAGDIINVDNDNNDVLLLQQQKNIKSIPYYKSTKTHLNMVIKNGSFKYTISELVKKMHLLRMISTHVLKLYIIQKRMNYPNFDFTQIIDKNS